MIIKDLDSLDIADPLTRAGRRAEEQMAYYLRRAFGEAPEVYLFHDLRLERDGDTAQIDHLLLHRYGVIVIESKSVTALLEVNELGEWCWNFRGKRRGIPSPVEQARRQGEFLRSYLQAHRELLRGKYLLGLMQGGFRHLPVDVLVAISDEGIIRRPSQVELPEVLKADQVAARVQEMLREHRRINSPFNLKLNETGYEFRPDELERISDFLRQHHRPVRRSAQGEPVNASGPVQSPPGDPPAPASASPGAAASASGGKAHACRHCRSSRLWVTWGRYGYYFKCADCQGNTPIREECSTCGQREKLRKAGLRFFAECGACATSRIYYVNPD